MDFHDVFHCNRVQRSNIRIEQSNEMNDYFDGNLLALDSYYGLHTDALSR